jgi:predicted Zn finger-like uncharacterized protein
VKFLCDRCKTRYSISDDRVRGKILKIRCKNCANVITVREGMAEADPAAAEDPRRRKSPTTNAPMAHSTQTASSPLSAAFATQLSKPPPALEEEWYVSIDGVQSGPFSLGEAQRWVAAKPFEAELHCWSEGFDDWLPVDKVSHFRGLRKKPLPAMPPPLPRAVPRLAPVEDEPKPLFAATMAALEKGSGPARSPGSAAGSSSGPTALKSNGAGIAPALPAVAKAPGPAAPTLGKASSGPVSSNGSSRTATVQGVGGSASPAANALAAAFDVNTDSGEVMTTVEPVNAFLDDLPQPVAGPVPVSVKPRVEPAKQTKPATFEARGAKADARGPKPDASDGTPEDGLDIGEVSRVVNLADLAKAMGPAPARKSNTRAPMLRASGSAPRMSSHDFGQTGPFQPIVMGPNGEPIPSASVVARARVTASRRGMIILLAAAAALLVVTVGVVLLVQKGSDDTPQGNLRQVNQISTERPDDVVRKFVEQAKSTPAPNPTGAKVGTKRWIATRPTGSPAGPEVADTDPTKRELESDEIEDMAAKQSSGTDFCYKRAQRGAIGIEIMDLKKLQVTMSVDKDGVVNSVQLSDHQSDSLGICLASRIRGWKFRQSSGTKTFKFTLVFQH